MNSTSQEIQHLLDVFKRSPDWQALPDEERIRVGEFSSKLATIYEKIRNAVEYHEEHLLRRNAIARIIKRRMVRGASGKDIARPFVEELIRARYLPNNTLPERIIDEVAVIIDKYILLINEAVPQEKRKHRQQTYIWIIGLLASELEEFLVPHHRERALVDAMFRIVRNETVFLEEAFSERERDIQLYLAVHRSLLKADPIWLRYQLLKTYYPSWTEHREEVVREVVGRFSSMKEEIESILKHRLAPYLAKVLQPYAVLFWIVKDILEKEPKRAQKIFERPSVLHDFIRQACKARYQRSYEVLRRSAFRSVVFIFATKIILAFILELPFDWYVFGEIAWIPLGLNVFFHPLLLILIAATTRVPSEKNTQKIIQGIEWVVYHKREEKILFRTMKIPSPHTMKGLLTNTLYLVMYLVSFSIIFWGLKQLGFNIVSSLLFVLFLSLVSFFGIRIRQSARELIVVRQRENVITTLFDFFTVPVVRAGRWVTLKFSRVNIFVFILDFIIEAPYKVLVEVFDDLIAFVRYKKEEMY